MNKFYIIFPLVALVGFGFYYNNFNTKYEGELAAKKAEADQKKADDEARKKKAEEIAATEAANQLKKSRDDEEAEKAKRREARRLEDEAVKKQTDDFIAEANALSVELGQLQAKLAELRRTRAKAQDDAFELAHQVELAKIERRNAENEIQRATQMMTDRVGGSSLVEAPIFPVPTPPGKSNK